MIGSQQIILDASDWIRGMSSGPEVSDGGFSTQTEAVNLIAEPGVIYAPNTTTDIDTDAVLNTDAEIIATCPDAEAGSPNNRLVMAADDDSEEAEFLRYNGTKLVDVTNGDDATRNYAKGFSDMVVFAGACYFTSKEQLGEWLTASDTFNFTFSAAANTAVPHPLLVYENNLFWADGNLLKRMSAVSGTVSTILTLSTNEYIQALGIDQGSGKMLLSVEYGQNASGLIPRTHKIMWYDGFSNKILKSIHVEDQVYAFHSHGGVTYIGYGENIGYMNGSGVTFLRRLLNVTRLQTQLPYKHNWASIGRNMYVVDGGTVLAMSDIISGRKIFYYALKNKTNANIIDCIFEAGNNTLGFSFAENKARSFPILTTTGLDKLDLRLNWINFPRPVYLRSVSIETVSTGSSGNFSITYTDQAGNSGTFVRLAEITSVSEFSSIPGATNKVKAVKLRIENATENDGIKRIILYYDPAE